MSRVGLVGRIVPKGCHLGGAGPRTRAAPEGRFRRFKGGINPSEGAPRAGFAYWT